MIWWRYCVSWMGAEYKLDRSLCEEWKRIQKLHVWYCLDNEPGETGLWRIYYSLGHCKACIPKKEIHSTPEKVNASCYRALHWCHKLACLTVPLWLLLSANSIGSGWLKKKSRIWNLQDRLILCLFQADPCGFMTNVALVCNSTQELISPSMWNNIPGVLRNAVNSM